ncbi:efflux RND transporter periplasmic adaptor subunit [Roseomonas elaeocarpi]|uniref:Efflux RND transporter periplasmic adaptor subunit n=1 Tax=Roseomonas elaeocarpi TaxID=907779 RepID=A0ABV6JPN3_9PROT
MPPALRTSPILGLLLGSLASLASTAGQAQEAASPNGRGGGGAGGAPAVAVAVQPATVGSVPVEVTTNGVAEAPSVISVRSRVDGQVERVLVNEGDTVQAGQVLFTLDSRVTQAQLAQQQANLDRDRATAARAASDAQRYASLRSGAFASVQQADQAQAEAVAAAATVRADEAMLAQTRLNLDFATIRAEAPGRLGALPVKAGNFVRASEGVVLATITQTNPILVSFSVPEGWLGELRAAQARGEKPKVLASRPSRQTAEQGGAAGPGQPAVGELVFVDSAVDSTTGTIKLKGRFSNEPARLWPGQFLEVALVPREEPNTLSVPAEAVQRGQQGAFLFTVHDNTARRVGVRVVRYVNGRAVLADAQVANGEPVVTEGAVRLQDGMRVAVRSPENKNGGAGATVTGEAAKPDAPRREASR